MRSDLTMTRLMSMDATTWVEREREIERRDEVGLPFPSHHVGAILPARGRSRTPSCLGDGAQAGTEARIGRRLRVCGSGVGRLCTSPHAHTCVAPPQPHTRHTQQ